ncbi:hypothetical protein EN850_02910 [Mesorhizobium sp. M8A.F.Ca.ET.207.01.1.1]|uniref:hypothetical protein n=1 Tax=Mesorhizobium sp. M8A.F.Ca.ET.207.01.1.1 TaxID=2563968 RepID=UPI00109CADB0|nr:hypothetical protein [Mesorhizobium sp. M8A.F.Ca.ET.207.01.1.1]TGQ83709.1 hypothetical protein EN850_02910 [Mesorhizobium sp. M8A.F.Ca.ET.207.01.1.1]
MPEERARWLHPDEIQRGGPSKPERYCRAWQSLYLKMDDYRFERWSAFSSTDKYIDDDEAFKTLSAKMTESGWDSLDKEEKKTFGDRHLKAIHAEPAPEGMTLTGWASMDGFAGSTIVSFAVENDPNYQGRSFDKDYAKSFNRIQVSLHSSNDDRIGSLSILGESWRELSRRDPDDDSPDEDILHASVSLPLERMKALADELAGLPRRPRLKMNMSSLLFQEESERVFYPGRPPRICDDL